MLCVLDVISSLGHTVGGCKQVMGPDGYEHLLSQMLLPQLASEHITNEALLHTLGHICQMQQSGTWCVVEFSLVV